MRAARSYFGCEDGFPVHGYGIIKDYGFDGEVVFDKDVRDIGEVKKLFWGDYKVYVHTFPDGRRYVGQTSKPLVQRWGNGGGYKTNRQMYEAIRRFGWGNIKHDVVKSGLNERQSLLLEDALIEKYGTTDSAKGFNKSRRPLSSMPYPNIIFHFCDFYFFPKWGTTYFECGDNIVVNDERMHLRLMDLIEVALFTEKRDATESVRKMVKIKSFFKNGIYYPDWLTNACWSEGLVINAKEIGEGICNVEWIDIAGLDRPPMY